MSRIKQLIANGKSSYNDFGLYIKERNPSLPTRRTNKLSVPGMHGTYDFSELYGEVIYDDRTVEYKFDITGWDVEDLDNERRKVLDWIMNIQNTEIVDEYNPNYHWLGSYENGSWKEEAEQGLLTVKFSVYPFAISNEYRDTYFQATSKKETITINNESSHRIAPIIITDGNVLIEFGNQRISLASGEWRVENFYLLKGENKFVVSGNANVCIRYSEEVF